MARGFHIGNLLYWKHIDVDVVHAVGTALQME